ncbi:MAG: hypothetical protein Q3986_06835 [Akkermansia sp.]|nr:hypothetical protein [Akkermansia sp.]
MITIQWKCWGGAELDGVAYRPSGCNWPGGGASESVPVGRLRGGRPQVGQRVIVEYPGVKVSEEQRQREQEKWDAGVEWHRRQWWHRVDKWVTHLRNMEFDYEQMQQGIQFGGDLMEALTGAVLWRLRWGKYNRMK